METKYITQSDFIRWYYNTFQLSDLYKKMEAVSENSPWHRERTVAIHTDMVVSEYLAITQWAPDFALGALACAFHDVGKPMSRKEKYKPERGTYYGYSGHEPASARLWEDYAVKNWDVLSDVLGLRPKDIFTVGWLIENHRPWGTKDKDRMEQIVKTIIDYTGSRMFVDVLISDNRGRIGDNHEENLEKSYAWLEEIFEPHYRDVERTFYDDCGRKLDTKENRPVLVMPISASGSGKSTFFTSGYADKIAGEILPFSLDTLRLDWYGPDYAEAFKKSCEDNGFENKTKKVFKEMISNNENVYVDNTNTSRKRRKFYLDEAKRAGYKTIAVLFPIDLDTVQARQKTRGDKCVPPDAVHRQYFGLSLPSIGEFDEIIVHPNNLK